MKRARRYTPIALAVSDYKHFKVAIMKTFISIFLILIFLTASGQIKVSNLYLGLGYNDSKLTEFNDVLNPFPFDSIFHFHKLNGFNDISLGFMTSFSNISKFHIDFSMGYLFHSKQQADFMAYKEFKGLTYDSLTGEFILILGDTATYNYSFQINTIVLEITPTYSILTDKRFFIELGFGPILYYSRLNQEGVKIITSPTLWQTSQDKEVFTGWTISWQGSIDFGLKLVDGIFLDLMIKYRFGRVKGIGANNTLFTIGSSLGEDSIFPITKTTIDYSGLNYMLKLKYYL
jgi:hypothetical protein